MSSRSLGELLLRPSSLARTPLCNTHSIRRTSPSWIARRSISSTPPQPAPQSNRNDDPFSLGSNPSRDDDPFSFGSQPARSNEPPSFGSQSEAPQTVPIRRVGQETRSSENSPRRGSLFAPSQSSSSDEVRAARNNHVFGAGFGISPGGARRTRQAPKLNFDDMALPTDMLDPNMSNKPSEAASLATQQAEAFANFPRLNPTYGRTIELDVARGRDLVRGIGMLGSLVTRNKIKHEASRQRFHERGGLKRKRLASERWRARFKIGFRTLTKRVGELNSKGW